jgi:hypothetical protein
MSFKGYNHTQKAIEKIRAYQKNKTFSIATRLKISQAKLGRKNTKEHNENISKAKNGKPNKLKGIKTGLIPINGFKVGTVPWNKGVKWDKKTKEKMSLSKLNKTKELSNAWKDGRARNKHSLTNPEYKFWRKSVFERDNWKCKISNTDCKGILQAHHILRWVDFPELRFNINNGITLCVAHHPRKRAEEKRLSPYFMELVSVSKVSHSI